MTKATLQKLKDAFKIGSSDEEACYYAEISKSTLYTYQKKNKGFLEEKERFKSAPVLKARQTVVKNLDDPGMAFNYLVRKRRDEFASKQVNEHEAGRSLAEIIKKKLKKK